MKNTKKTKKPKLTPVEFIVPRSSENTYAIVTAQVVLDTRSLHLADEFFKALRKAVTQWIRSTKEGREALDSSSEDMNIGDIAQDGISPKLKKELEKVGIFGMDVDTNSRAEEHNWEFDDHLFEDDWESCEKCGSTLKENGRCPDKTCPYSDRQQDETYTEG